MHILVFPMSDGTWCVKEEKTSKVYFGNTEEVVFKEFREANPRETVVTIERTTEEVVLRGVIEEIIAS